MSPREIKAALAELGGGANKRLGQHFLIDAAALAEIVKAADLHRGEVVLEIGPGLGVLTGALLDAGATVIAIERDHRYVTFLHQKFAGAIREKRLTIVEGDAMRVEWSFLLASRPWKFVSNLPYSITSFALRQALWAMHPPESLTVLIQREVAERAIAKDGHTSLLSLMIALACSEQKIVKRVAPGAFYPPPRVESAVLFLRPMSTKERKKHWGIEPELVMKQAKQGFTHPRKFLASNLELTEAQKELFARVPLSLKVRPEAVSVAEWVRWTKLVEKM